MIYTLYALSKKSFAAKFKAFGTIHRHSTKLKDNVARGFTLIEILISAVIIGILGAGVAAMLTSGNNAFVRTRDSNLLEQTIDTDLALIKDTAFRMTCCTGSCTTEAGIISPPCSASTAPGDQNYYFPDPDSIGGPSAIINFENLCNNGGLATSLAGLIGQPNLPTGITRQFDTSQASSHRLTVIYTDGQQSRAYTAVPTVAAWCP
jgi:prepilin-type N-terminal cleavage/methylation domain-containing protein